MTQWLANTDWFEVTAATVGLLYIWLEYKASVWLWLTGIIMPAMYIWIYYNSGFYADMGINVYFLLAGLYGWLYWLGKTRGRRSKDDGKKELPITRTPSRYWLPLAAVTPMLFSVIVYILITYTDSEVPYGDSFTTALSVAGLWLLTRKYVEQWLVWIAVDIVSSGLYFYKGLYPTAVLYAIYTVIAVLGYFRWLKIAKDGEK